MAKHVYRKDPNAEKETKGGVIQYKPEYCQMLIEHMASGLSFEAFAGVVDTCRKTLYNWEANFPEFKEAHDKAVAKHLLYMMINAQQGMWNMQGEGSRNLNFNVWRFIMKNIHQWRDTVDAEQKTEVNVGNMSDEQLKEIVLQAANELKAKSLPPSEPAKPKTILRKKQAD